MFQTSTAICKVKDSFLGYILSQFPGVNPKNILWSAFFISTLNVFFPLFLTFLD